MGRGENGRYEREAAFIRENRDRLRRTFLEPSYTGRALEWKVNDEIYRRIVDEVTSLTSHGIDRTVKRYRAARVTTEQGALEMKRQLLLEIELFAKGDASLE